MMIILYENVQIFILVVPDLTHCGLVMLCGDIDLGGIWLR